MFLATLNHGLHETMFLSLRDLAFLFLQHSKLPLIVIIGVALILAAAITLAIYLRKRVNKIEKENENEWTSSMHSLFVHAPQPEQKTEPDLPAERLDIEPVEEMSPAAAGETRLLATERAPQEPEPDFDSPAPVVETETRPLAPKFEEQAPQVQQTMLLHSEPQAEAYEEPVAEMIAEETRVEETPVEAAEVEPRASQTEALVFDEEVWSRLNQGEQPPQSSKPTIEETRPLRFAPEQRSEPQPPALEIPEPTRTARVEHHSTREPFEPPRIERISHREPFEPPRIEPLTPRAQADLVRERGKASQTERESIGREDRIFAREPVVNEPPPQEPVRPPADYVASSYQPSPADYQPSAPSLEAVRMRKAPSGSVLGLPAETTGGPLVLGEPVRSEDETGIGALSQYGQRPKEKTGHTGTIILLILVILIGGVIAAVRFNFQGWGDRFNAIFARKIEDKGPKARIAGFSPTAANKIVRAGGIVENISNDTLEGLLVEVTLQRLDESVIETRTVAVTPSTLAPGERGRFEFEYPQTTNADTYSVTKLMANDKQILFTSNQQK